MALSTASNSAVPREPKKILLSFDGTGNNLRDHQPAYDPEKGIDRSITNVLKLHLLAGGDINLRRNDVPGQICIYQRGVGGISTNPIVAGINYLRGDLTQQIEPMREKLKKIYQKGDKLYIIGFSRGAASARMLVAELERDGLVTASNERIEKPAVEFLGCFDTISLQLQLPNVYGILKTRLLRQITKARVIGEQGGKIPSIVKTAVHVLPMDDNRFRGAFSPVYMDSHDARVHETWVAGEHVDSGGSKYTKGMPDCSCKYMQEWLEYTGLSFISNHEIHPDCLQIDDFPNIYIDKKDLDIVPDPTDKIHSSDLQLFFPSYRPIVTVTNEQIVRGGTVRVHVSALHHMEAMEKKGTPYAINPTIKDTDRVVVVVVGPLDNVLEEETQRFKELLART
mmetsp:Transcript_5165/g.10691  ORF Transcript_5165/g.10691 Transcript_5165/m.10691 type:complete len:396 (+) Transcript_5165:51-1238(+)